MFEKLKNWVNNQNHGLQVIIGLTALMAVIYIGTKIVNLFS